MQACPRIAASTLALFGCLAGAASCGEDGLPDVDPPGAAADTSTADAAVPALGATEPATSWTLDEATRTYLWEMEHDSNVLGRYGFGAIRRALDAEDETALLSLLAADFEGDRLASPEEVHLADGLFEGVRVQSSGNDPRAMSRDEFVAFLMDVRRRFPEAPGVAFGVKQIFPTDRDDLGAPWSVLCQMRIRGETAPGAPREMSCILRLRIARPTEERLQRPEWLLRCSVLEVETTASKRDLFAPVTESLGFPPGRLYDNWDNDEKLNVTGGVYACDFDRDGCTDMLVTDINRGGNALLRGLPEGGFEHFTRDAGLLSLRGRDPEPRAAFVDLDGDGWEDLVLANGRIWRNDEGRAFIEVTDSSNLRALLGEPAITNLSVVDYDRDGRMDLYLARAGGLPSSWLADTTDSISRSHLLRNTGDWQFEDVTERTGADGGARSVFTGLWFDVNADGWPDLYVINEFGDGALYVNESGTSFRELDVNAGRDDFGAMGTACGDIDNDGDIDLYVASMYSKAGSRVMANMPPDAYPEHVMQRLRRLISGSELYLNDGGLEFSPHGAASHVHAVGWAWGPTLSDFNNDGLLDLFVTSGYMSRDRTKPDG
jgi:hypothetical protein